MNITPQKKNTLVAGIASFLLFSPMYVTYASITFNNPLKSDSIQELVILLLDAAIQIGIVVAVVMFMLAGFKYITAYGDPGKVSDAHSMLAWTSVGLVVLTGSKALVEVLKNTIDKL